MFEIGRLAFRVAHRARFRRLLAVLAIAVLPLSADTLVSTFSSGNPSYETDTGAAWTLGGSGNVELSVGFQDPSVSMSYLLTQIQVADNFFTANPDASTNPTLNNLIVGIWQSATNNPNDAVELQSWSVAAPATTGNPGQIFAVTSALPIIINPTDYYFITETITPDGTNTANWGWQENNLTPMQIGYYAGTNGVPGSWSLADTPCTVNPCTAANDADASGTPAFSVSGNLIMTPEPRTSALLLAAGFVGFLFERRRRNTAVRSVSAR